ncbi:hypothetical protein AMAG_17323 [Allomyces macrogynus ATCC 38327]|uniref:SNF2 N-terminal domain-containing protein n=1 Tax=Allomyces macrogynus (strain ATCC 38327) TaxID=578462 RepID=A0A0L0TEF0_ALLM3|nr:hypothetical protein AMAG_17323 [Allomyces macrogynus ATCC 38327]|eukprot:KNE73055.1 hypothetical protein AMAG_17323 [Allomyces macrogynus ATCC 38327]
MFVAIHVQGASFTELLADSHHRGQNDSMPKSRHKDATKADDSIAEPKRKRQRANSPTTTGPESELHLDAPSDEFDDRNAVSDSQAAIVGQQDNAMSNFDEDVPAEAWWRFYPDVLSRKPEDDVTGPWCDGDFSGELAAPDDDESERQQQAETPAVHPQLANDTNELFVSSGGAWVQLRLPMPPGSLDMSTLKCVDPTVLADVTIRKVPVLRVRRPRITSDGFFEYSWGIVTEDMYYVHPNSTNMSPEELASLTVNDFAELEAKDPYYDRANHVNPTEGREDDEVVNSDGSAEAEMGIERSLVTRLVFSLNSDAFWRHDGDCPERPGSNFHQDSYATGRVFIASSGTNNIWDWTADRDQYYRIVLCSVKDKPYPPPGTHAMSSYYVPNHELEQYQYDVSIYLKTDIVNAALRKGIQVPGLKDQIASVLQILEARHKNSPPHLYVPNTILAGHALSPTPLGFQLELRDFQKRTLAWLLALERSRHARTIRIHHVVGLSPPAQQLFERTTMFGCPNWIRLGPGGMWANLATLEMAEDPSVWSDQQVGTAELECRGALEVSMVGAGKTVMALSLVTANPFRSARVIPWDDPQDKFKYLVSRATLIVVRSNLVMQWVAEAQKALPLGYKIVQVATIRDHLDLTWNDVLLADVVIISLEILQDTDYQNKVAELIRVDGGYCLPRAAYQQAPGNDMSADAWSRWKRWAQEPAPTDAVAFNDLMDAHVAQLHERTRALFGADKGCVIFDRVYWYRIVIDGIHELSHVQGARAYDEEAADTRTAETLLFCLKTRFRLGLTAALPSPMRPADVSALAEAVGVRNLLSTVADTQAFLNTHVRRSDPDLAILTVHFQTIWVDLTPAELDLMAPHQQQSVRSQLLMCNLRRQINDDVVPATGIMVKSDVPMDEPEEGKVGGAESTNYGSKIKALVQFVRRVVRADPTSKLILFSQFHQLTALMAHAFTEFGIGNVKLMGGNVISKRRAVTLFRNDPDMKVLFLSAEDSVLGLQLTEANHVVIVHPFLGESEAMARAYEMQGCARAVRAGQEREVTITRFVTRGTIEEELTARRNDLHRPQAAVDGVEVEESGVGN